MKIDVEKQPNCIVGVRVEVEPERVRKERSAIVGAFGRQMRVPGYRPGKVPPNIIETRLKKEIEEELRQRLLSAGLREAVQKEQLKVLSVVDVKEATLGFDDFFNFKATLAIEPEFELPDYEGIPVEIPKTEPTDAEIDDMIEMFRARHANFIPIEGRALQMEDYAQIDYAATQDGKPLNEAIPDLPPNLAAGESQWLRIAPGVLLPGFCEQLLGAQAGEKREFDLDVPIDFVEKKLAGERVHFEVTITTFRERVLPAIDEDLAKALGTTSVAEMRQQVASSITRMKMRDIERSKRDQIMEYLVTKVDCELPANLVYSETRRIVDQIVKVNSERGVPQEKIKENEKEIVGGAARNAQSRVRGTFILLKIAEKEGIRVSPGEFDMRLAALAESVGKPAAKLRKELESSDALGRLEEEFLQDKVMDFLVSKANITESNAVAQPDPDREPSDA